MLIGGLLKVIVHRPGLVRSVSNCEESGMAHFLMLIGRLLVTYKCRVERIALGNRLIEAGLEARRQQSAGF